MNNVWIPLATIVFSLGTRDPKLLYVLLNRYLAFVSYPLIINQNTFDAPDVGMKPL